MCKIVQCSMTLLANALALALSSAPVMAQGSWRPLDENTGEIDSVAELEALAQDFPNSASVRLRFLNAHIAADDWRQALAVAEHLAAEGYAFLPAACDYLQGLVRTGMIPAWLSANDLNAEPIAASDVVTEIPSKALLPEGLSVTDDWEVAVSTLVSRDLWILGRRNWREEFPDWYPADLGSLPDFPKLLNVSGIALVEVEGRESPTGFVLASSDLGMLPPETDGFSGLIVMSPGRNLRLLPAPEGVSLSDIAVGPDGTVFASAPLHGGVYMARPDSVAMEPFVAAGVFRSPQGITPSEDGSHVYISDYRYGLAIVDAETGEVSRLPADAPMLLDGIDGLWLHDGELIAVQNGLSPMRIVALTLSEDGNRITAMRVLERANPEWTEPLGGDIFDGALYYIGNGSWDLYEEGGTLREGAELRPTQIRRLELAENPTE